MLWVTVFGLTVHALWIAVPLGFWAWSRKHFSERTKILLESGVISLASALLLVVLFSFFLPDQFLPWYVVSFIAVVPALVLGATIFFVLSRPASRHKRIHEAEALTFFVVVVAAFAFALPFLVVSATVSEHYAFEQGTQLYWGAHQQTLYAVSSNHSAPPVLLEYAHGYLDEFSALIQFWSDNPPERCIDCFWQSHRLNYRHAFGVYEFAGLAQRIDQYAVFYSTNPEGFERLEECVFSSQAQIHEIRPIVRPSDVSVSHSSFFMYAVQRYIAHTDFTFTGYALSAEAMQISDDLRKRAYAIAEQVSESEEDLRVLRLAVEADRRMFLHCDVRV